LVRWEPIFTFSLSLTRECHTLFPKVCSLWGYWFFVLGIASVALVYIERLWRLDLIIVQRKSARRFRLHSLPGFAFLVGVAISAAGTAMGADGPYIFPTVGQYEDVVMCYQSDTFTYLIMVYIVLLAVTYITLAIRLRGSRVRIYLEYTQSLISFSFVIISVIVYMAIEAGNYHFMAWGRTIIIYVVRPFVPSPFDPSLKGHSIRSRSWLSPCSGSFISLSCTSSCSATSRPSSSSKQVRTLFGATYSFLPLSSARKQAHHCRQRDPPAQWHQRKQPPDGCRAHLVHAALCRVLAGRAHGQRRPHWRRHERARYPRQEGLCRVAQCRRGHWQPDPSEHVRLAIDCGHEDHRQQGLAPRNAAHQGQGHQRAHPRSLLGHRD